MIAGSSDRISDGSEGDAHSQRIINRMVLGMEIEEEKYQSIEEMKVSYALEEEKVAFALKEEEDWSLIECDESKNIGG